MRIRAEHGGGERVRSLDDAGAGDEVSHELARRPPVEIARVEVVRRVDHDLTFPLEPLHGLRDAAPRYGDDDDVGSRCLVDRSRRHSLAERRHDGRQRFGAPAVGDQDAAAGTERRPSHGLPESAGADDPHGDTVVEFHRVPSSYSDANR